MTRCRVEPAALAFFVLKTGDFANIGWQAQPCWPTGTNTPEFSDQGSARPERREGSETLIIFMDRVYRFFGCRAHGKDILTIIAERDEASKCYSHTIALSWYPGFTRYGIAHADELSVMLDKDVNAGVDCVPGTLKSVAQAMRSKDIGSRTEIVFLKG